MTKELSVNSNEKLNLLKEEVELEFTTSKSDIYKDALRECINSKNELINTASIAASRIRKLDIAIERLDESFRNGDLISHDDARKVINEVCK